MGVRKDLNQAKKRGDLAGRIKVEVVRDEHGVVREARTPALARPPVIGSIADLPFTNAAEAPDAVVLRRGEFTEANGLLTPSLKIRRHAVTMTYAAEIEALYGGLRSYTGVSAAGNPRLIRPVDFGVAFG